MATSEKEWAECRQKRIAAGLPPPLPDWLRPPGERENLPLPDVYMGSDEANCKTGGNVIVKNYIPVEGVELAKVYEVALEMQQADREGRVKRDIAVLMSRRDTSRQFAAQHQKELERFQKQVAQLDERLTKIAGGDWTGFNEPDDAA